MFSKKPRNELSSVVFTDSTLKSLTKNDQEAVLQLLDYCDSLLEIRFLGVSRVLAPGPVDGVEIMEAEFRWTGDAWVAAFRDDDGETVVEMSYRAAEIAGTS